MRFVAALLGVLIAASSGAAFAAGRQNFTLINRTTYPIEEVYLSATGASEWGKDVLGADLLENNRKVDITFPNRARACKWDIRVVFSDGDDAEWEKFDLCTVSTITIRYNRQKNETWAEYE